MSGMKWSTIFGFPQVDVSGEVVNNIAMVPRPWILDIFLFQIAYAMVQHSEKFSGAKELLQYSRLYVIQGGKVLDPFPRAFSEALPPQNQMFLLAFDTGECVLVWVDQTRIGGRATHTLGTIEVVVPVNLRPGQEQIIQSIIDSAISRFLPAGPNYRVAKLAFPKDTPPTLLWITLFVLMRLSRTFEETQRFFWDTAATTKTQNLALALYRNLGHDVAACVLQAAHQGNETAVMFFRNVFGPDAPEVMRTNLTNQDEFQKLAEILSYCVIPTSHLTWLDMLLPPAVGVVQTTWTTDTDEKWKPFTTTPDAVEPTFYF